MLGLQDGSSVLVRSLIASLSPIFLATAAAAQPTFSVDYQGPPKGFPDSFIFFPITEGDILTPPAPLFLPGFGLAPPLPAIQRSAGFAPGGLLLPAAPGAAGLPAGIPGFVEVDAFSYGTDLPVVPTLAPATVMWVFSVDEWAMGNPAMPVIPSVATLSAPPGAPSNVAAAIFRDLTIGSGPNCGLLFPPGGNTILLDGNGVPPPFPPVLGVGLPEPTVALPVLPDLAANLDGLDVDTVVGPPGAALGTPVYFSLDSGFGVFDPLEGVFGTGSALANGFASGGDVLMTVPGAVVPVVFAPALLLGLDLFGVGTDDLDALILWENGTGVFEPPVIPFSWVGGGTDMVFFSVRRGSAVIGLPASGPGGCPGLPISPGDILWPPAAPGLPPRIWITAEQLGLQTMRSGFMANDDVDALDVTFDCNSNNMVDSIETGLVTAIDCNRNRIPDSCDIASGMETDCNGNGIPDSCEVRDGTAPDCNGNGIPDSCDVVTGAATDCNGNGVPDICDTHPLTFATPDFYGGSLTAEFMTAADLNGDGLTDLAYIAPGGGLLGVRVNAGAGIFGAEDVYTVPGMSLRDLAAGDFDGDGDTDLAIANAGAAGGVIVALNTGIGTFPAYSGPFLPAGPPAYGVIAADFDGDTDVDLATTHATTGTMMVLTNTSLGGVISFAGVVLPAGLIPFEIRAASVDADADLDLVVCIRGGGSIGVYINTAGVFGPPIYAAAGPGPSGLALADVDSDGDIDAAVANIDAPRASAVLLNGGGGVFGAPSFFTNLGQYIHAGDLDGDNDPDLVGLGLNLSAFRAVRNTGAGAFPGPGTAFSPGTTAGAGSELADLNGDGRPDLAYGISGGIAVALAIFAPTSADVDGDGVPDECAGCCAADFNCDGTVDFFDYLDFVDAFSSGAASADFNSDGVIDFFDYLDFVDAFSIGCP